MTFPNRMKDSKASRLMTMGLMLLVMALMLRLFVHPVATLRRNLIHGVDGILFGVAIVMLLWSSVQRRRMEGDPKMVLPNRAKAAKAVLLVPIGMMFLVMALVLRYLHPTASLGPGLIDGVDGLLFGLAIGMNLLSVVLLLHQRRSSES